MKTSIFLLFILLFTLTLSCETKSDVSTIKQDTIEPTTKKEESLTFLKSLSKTDILTKFFNPYKISNDTAIWKQDLESIEMRVSADGYMHTVIDSIYKIDDQILLILFTTYDIMKDGQIKECHPCGIDYSLALIVKETDGYAILRFKKHLISTGNFGRGAGGEIVDLKNGLKAIKIGGGWVGTGAVMFNENYFNIIDFENLIHLETRNSNEGMCDETDLKCIDKTERELIPFDKHPSNKPAIIIKYKHTYFDKKLIIIEKSDTLIYDGYHFNKDIYYEGV
jgi:hypothetical protein